MDLDSTQCIYDTEAQLYHRFGPAFIICVLIVCLFIRHLTNKFISYMTILTILGAVVRLVSEFNSRFQAVMSIMSIKILRNPNSLIQLILPMMLFVSGYTLNNPIFMDIIYQCMILSVLGYSLLIIFTSTCMLYLFPSYEWHWQLSVVFAIVVQIADPLGSSDIFKGNSREMKHVSTLIQGECLIINALAVMIIEVILPTLSLQCQITDLILTFFKNSVISLMIGFAIGNAIRLFLLFPYHNRVTVIIILFATCYFIFAITLLLRSSGGLAMVVVIIIVNNEKYGFSPEVNRVVEMFWELWKYVLEIFLSLIIGIIQAEAILHMFDRGSLFLEDYLRVFITYVVTLILRIFIIVMLSPLLSKTGYGFNWKKCLVISIGFMRGSITLLLGQIAGNIVTINSRSKAVLFSQIRTFTSLTILINVIVMKYLLNITGIDEVSSARKAVMANAVHYLKQIVEKSLNIQRFDPFLLDASWQWTKIHRYINDPYLECEIKSEDIPYYQVRYMTCTNCSAEHTLPPTNHQFMQLRKESNLRALKTAQAIYWRQFYKRIIDKNVAKRLSNIIESAIQTNVEYININASLVKKLLATNKCTEIFNEYILKFLESVNIFTNKEYKELEKGEDRNVSFRQQIPENYTQMDKLVNSSVLEYLIHTIIIISLLTNIIKLISEVYLNIESAFFVTFISIASLCSLSVEIIILLLDILLRLFVFGLKEYFKNPINVFCFIVEIVDIFLILFYCLERSVIYTVFTYAFFCFLLHVHLIICIRLVFLVKPFLIKINKLLSEKIKRDLYLSFEIGYCFIAGEEELSGKIAMIVEYEGLLIGLKENMEKNRINMIREMIQMQHLHPDIVIGAKTRVAARIVLRNDMDYLKKLKNKGLISPNDFYKLKRIYEKKVKMLYRMPIGISVKLEKEDILRNTEWIVGQQQYKYFNSVSIIKTYEQGSVIHSRENLCSGIHIILSGIVRVKGMAHYHNFDYLPSTNSMKYFDSNGYFEEYLSTGRTLGLIGIMNESAFVTHTVCETQVTTTFISETQLKDAMNRFHILEYQIWKVLAEQIAIRLLKYHPCYQLYSNEKLRETLRGALLPNLYKQRSLNLSRKICDVILIQGRITDENVKREYRGPVHISTDANTLLFSGSSDDRIRPIVLLLVSEDYTLLYTYQWIYEGYNHDEHLCPRHKDIHIKTSKKFSKDIKHEKSAPNDVR